MADNRAVDFYKKIQSYSEATDPKQITAISLDIDRDIKLELLLFLKSQIENITQKHGLKNIITNILERRIVEGEDAEADPDAKVSNAVLLKLLEILSKSDNESADSVLSILKQQIIIQQNNNNTGGSSGSGGILTPAASNSSNEQNNAISRQEYHDLKMQYEKLLRTKDGEFTEIESENK